MAMQSRIIALEARDTKAKEAAEDLRDRVICVLHAEGRSQRSIAKLFDISRSAVRHVTAARCVTVKVNDKDVVLPSTDVIALDILHYAELSDSSIKENFVLQRDDTQKSYIIGHEEKVEAFAHMEFTAIDPLDNA